MVGNKKKASQTTKIARETRNKNVANGSHITSESSKNGLLSLGMIVLLALCTVSMIFAIYCFGQVQNLKNTQIKATIAEVTPDEIVSEEEMTTSEEGVALTVANAMLEEYLGACAEKTDADEMMLLTMDVTVQNNTDAAIEISAYEDGFNNRWTLLGDNVEIRTTSELEGQAGACNQLQLQYRRPSSKELGVMTSDNYYKASEGGLNLQAESADRGLMLMNGESTTVKVYFGIHRDIDISNLSLQYEMGEIKTISPRFQIALETKGIYEALNQ